MDIHNLVGSPNVTQVNLKTIYNQCHGLVTCTWSSPWHGQHFADIVKLRRGIAAAKKKNQASRHGTLSMNPQPPRRDTSSENTLAAWTNPDTDTPDPANSEALEYLLENPTVDNVQQSPAKTPSETDTCLIINVPTRWNSSYHMFWRLLRTQEACNDFCKENKYKKYALLELEWGYVKQMCDFLEPLSEATKILCKSKYPTMHQVVLMYFVVLQGLKSVSISNICTFEYIQFIIF